MTELIWDGKYSKDGKKTAPVRIALPFQTIETVNESAQDRLRTLDLFAQGKPTEWRNRLIWGDKKYVLPSLLPEFAGKINLIYIDPPFDTGADFSFNATIPDNPDTPEDETTTFTKQPSILEVKAYRDTWGRGLDSYLQWFYETAVLLRELLADDGSIYVHLDWHVGHYGKAVLDEVFGYEFFKTELAWQRTSAHSDSKTYGNAHDVIYYFTKTDRSTWNRQFLAHDSAYVESHYRYVDENGRKYRTDNLTATGLKGGGYEYEWNGVKRIWRCPQATMQKLHDEGRIRYTRNGVAEYIRYLDEMPGTSLQSVWIDISAVNSQAKERVNYPTQKPEALLERIIKASSNENDLVLDCFCGSGTTPTVAEKLNRCWLACDLGRFAIHTTRKRLLGIANVKPFVVQNLGKYERQQWMGAEFKNVGQRLSIEQRYRHFILQHLRKDYPGRDGTTRPKR